MKNLEMTSKLAQNLFKLRKSMGLTQQQVADAVGIKRSTYAYYERGTTPTLEVIEKLAKVFNVTASYLMFPEEQMNNEGYGLNSGNGYTPKFDFITLSDSEQAFLLKYRLLNDTGKNQLLNKLDELLDKIDGENY